MKYKKKKSAVKMVLDKGKIEEYFYMIPKEVTVRQLADAVQGVSEDAKEIWSELDLMEIVLEQDSLVFENMMDTFDEPDDQVFLNEKGVKVVYAVNYNTKDEAAVKKVLEELYDTFGGFMATDTADLQPIFEVSEF